MLTYSQEMLEACVHTINVSPSSSAVARPHHRFPVIGLTQSSSSVNCDPTLPGDGWWFTKMGLPAHRFVTGALAAVPCPQRFESLQHHHAAARLGRPTLWWHGTAASAPARQLQSCQRCPCEPPPIMMKPMATVDEDGMRQIRCKPG